MRSNLFKVVFLIAIIGAAFFGSVISSFLENGADELRFQGCVNKNAKPQFVWEKQKDGKYRRIGTVEIVLDTKEKFRAKFIAEENWPGAILVIYKDSYPLAKDKKVNVSGRYMDDDFLWITEAKL